MLVHIYAGDRSFAHANAGTTVSGDESTEKLKQVRVMPDEHDVLPVGVLIDQLLEIGVPGAKVESGADFDLSVIGKFVADELGCLESPLEGAGDDDVRLDLEGTEKVAHEHALLFALCDETTSGVELCTITRNARICMPHEVKVHIRGVGSERAGESCEGKGIPA